MGELSEHLGVEQEELVMALDAGGDVESLHKPIYPKRRTGNPSHGQA